MKMIYQLLLCCIVLFIIPLVTGRGLLLLYRPKDISNDCIVSHHLRYDLSYGMGMSDTTTLVLRNMKEIDYECIIEIVTETADDIYLLIVIRFPNTIEANCARNRNAFTVFKKNKCLGICNLTGDRDANSPYFVITIRPRIRFRYISNSSINSDMDANFYQVTATAARKQPSNGCNSKNETVCDMQSDKYCFTSGVVCDGIKNCGVSDWYDERKSECETPSEHIGYAPVVAVVAVIICVVLAASHCMLRYLPMAANSFFIFNANEDNRLCIDTVFKHPDYPQDNIDNIKKTSIIPVSSSSNEDSMDQQVVNNETIDVTLKKIELQSPPETKNDPEQKVSPEEEHKKRKTTMRTMTDMVQKRLRSVTNRNRNDKTDAKIY